MRSPLHNSLRCQILSPCLFVTMAWFRCSVALAGLPVSEATAICTCSHHLGNMALWMHLHVSAPRRPEDSPHEAPWSLTWGKQRSMWDICATGIILNTVILCLVSLFDANMIKKKQQQLHKGSSGKFLSCFLFKQRSSSYFSSKCPSCIPWQYLFHRLSLGMWELLCRFLVT